MRTTLDQDLRKIETLLDEEVGLVQRAVRAAVNSLVRNDSELADEVIAFDDEIDHRYHAISEGIQTLLARQTPVAIDLRRVLAMLHVNLHLERMGDYCVTIAKLQKLAPDVSSPSTLVMDAFEEMGTRAEEMLSIAYTSFVQQELAGAESLVGLDEHIDRSNRRVLHYLLSQGSDPGLHEWGLLMILVSRCLERIGDHAVDIGEQTAYVVTGEFREFTDASSLEMPTG